jgi:hypothetical protein
MTFTVPAWLLWIAGGVGGIALLVAVIVMCFFAYLGWHFYKAFSRGIWR